MTIERAKELGSREWEKNNNRRLYLNVAAKCELLNLKIDNYKSGNIKSAYLSGEKISNSKAGKLLDSVRSAYYDLNTGELIK